MEDNTMKNSKKNVVITITGKMMIKAFMVNRSLLIVSREEYQMKDEVS